VHAQGRGFFRPGGARPPTEVMVSFIDKNKSSYGVEPICALLPIAPSTYYEAKHRQKDPSRLPERSCRDEMPPRRILRGGGTGRGTRARSGNQHEKIRKAASPCPGPDQKERCDFLFRKKPTKTAAVSTNRSYGRPRKASPSAIPGKRTRPCRKPGTHLFQQIKKLACGFRNRKRFKNVILFHLGGLDLMPSPAG
jgi:hypothetical protein